ncbi:hypothetical protein NKG05_06385 [Oerskovia sp. M15]
MLTASYPLAANSSRAAATIDARVSSPRVAVPVAPHQHSCLDSARRRSKGCWAPCAPWFAAWSPDPSRAHPVRGDDSARQHEEQVASRYHDQPVAEWRRADFLLLGAMSEYTKPWLSLDQQIEKLDGRGVDVDPRDRTAALLCAIGYYRITGYLYPLRSSEQYADGNGTVRRGYCRATSRARRSTTSPR